MRCVKQYLPDINGNTRSNSSFKVVKEKKKKKKPGHSNSMSVVGTNTVNYSLLEIAMRIKIQLPIKDC